MKHKASHIKKTRKRLERYVLSSWAAWVPTLFSSSLVILFAAIHLIALQTGHTSITNSKGEKVKFPMPPISLTANHPPEYFIYVFGCVAASFAAIRHISKLRKTVKDHMDYVVETISHPASEISVQGSPEPAGHRAHGGHRHHRPHRPRRHRSHRARGRSPTHPHRADINASQSHSRHPSGPRHSRQVSGRDRVVSPSHRAAFWRTHFHSAPRPEDTVTESDSGQSERDVWKYEALRRGELKRRPLLLIALVLLHIALIGFAVQAAFPAQENALEQLGAQCHVINAVKDGPLLLPAESAAEPMGDVESNSTRTDASSPAPEEPKESVPNSNANEPSPPPPNNATSPEASNDDDKGEQDEATEEGNSPPRTTEPPATNDESVSDEDESATKEGDSVGAEEPDHTLRRRLQHAASMTASNLVKKLKAFDPSRPIFRDPNSEKDTKVHGLVYCPYLEMMRADTVTLIHALGALTFFIVIYFAMGCFTIWLFHRRLQHRKHRRGICLLKPTWSSIIIKLFLTVIPWLRPLELVKSDILRHVSLVDWSGLAQRLAVGFVLLYVCSLGLEIRALKRGVESIQDVLPR